MTRIAFGLCIALILSGCAEQSAPKSLVFLTREGCVNTAMMRANLDDALRATGQPLQYEVIDLDLLPANDGRRFYPTPTVLYGSEDLFGLAAADAQAAPTTPT